MLGIIILSSPRLALSPKAVVFFSYVKPPFLIFSPQSQVHALFSSVCMCVLIEEKTPTLKHRKKREPGGGGAPMVPKGV